MFDQYNPATMKPLLAAILVLLFSPVAAMAQSDGGVVINVETKQPFGPSDPCLERGVTIHYNEAAMKKAHGDVLAFLKSVFGR